MSKHHRFYRPELDVLRCLAFLLVFLHHSALFPTGPFANVRLAGAFGLCLFFFLSAFLITDLLDREQSSTGTIGLGSFYARRVLRIWPLYFAALLLDFLHFHHAHPGLFTPGRLAAFVLLAGNWFVARYGFLGSFSMPLWSISIEEQFYVLWPSVRRFLGRRGAMAVALLAFALAYVALFYDCHAGTDLDTGIWVNSFVQFQFFASGALLALRLKGQTPSFARWHRIVLFLVGLCAFWIAQSVFHAKHGPTPALFRLALPGFLLVNAGCLALFLSLCGATPPRWGRPLIYLGKISYGLYVFHFFALIECGTFLHFLAPHWPVIDSHLIALRVPLALGCTVALASFSYHSFEKPILRFKQRFEIIRTRPV